MEEKNYFDIDSFKSLLKNSNDLHIGKYVNKNIYYSIELDNEDNLVIIEHEGKRNKNITVIKEPEYSFKAYFKELKCFVDLVKNKSKDNKIIHEVFKNSEFATTDYMESYNH